MPGGAYTIYASELAETFLGATLSFTSANYSVVNAGNTQYMPCVAPLGMNLLGIAVEAVTSVTATGATNTVANSDNLDLSTSGYEVSNQVGGGIRCKTITRKGVEEAERLFIAPPTSTSFVYPRATIASFTAAATQTANMVWIIPAAGGTAANVRIYWPGIASTYSTTANISGATVTYNLYAIPTLASFRTAFQEVTTRVVGAGQQDFASDIPAGMSPDIVELVATGWGSSSTTISKVVVDAQGGAGRAVDFEDSTVGNVAQTLFPTSQAANQTNAIFNGHKQRADHLWVTTNTSWSASVDFLFCEIDDGATLVPSPSPAATPAPSIAQNTATTGAGGAGVLPRRVAGGVGPAGGPAGGIRRQ